MAAKRKGSGLLAYPQELDHCLEDIFAGLPRGMSVSVKTRIGKNDPAEWPGLLTIYRKYPLSELIVHPRIQKEFYKGVPHRDAWAAVSGPWPAVYNGDIFTPEDAAALCRDYPGTDAAMLGRGLMRDPALLRRLRGGPAASAQELRTYHDRLLEAYRQRLSGDQPVMHRMWELWAYLSAGFARPEPYLKRMRKAKGLTEYQAAVDALFREQRYTT